MLPDNQQRQIATTPDRSFIVQAPAGSGKTEMLTQRYLRLLSTVDSPEQIVALTFTRKAANEMRERIFLALRRAATGEHPETSHQQQTFAYASAALGRSKQHHWQLLACPDRLRIMTLDALCQRLCQAIPLHEKQIPYAQITDTPQQNYQSAAIACLQHALQEPTCHDAIHTLLTHLDNQQDTLLHLFSRLLSRREQWVPLLYQARLQDKAFVEHALAQIEQQGLLRFCQSVPSTLQTALMELVHQIAITESSAHEAHAPLLKWNDFNQLQGEQAKCLAALLLTKDNKLRKAFDHHVLKREHYEKKEYDRIRLASKALLASLNEEPDFLPALLQVNELPHPQYPAEQWDVLQALFTLLPLLVAHLQLTFLKHNVVDFTAVTQQALDALGDEESPTDLTLYLDNQIKHLLVDEFQDTSIQQFQLLSQLVQGWQPDDGRTLFMVGDPMQSIYRFRSAEVGLFLRAQEQGIGPVALQPLTLHCNFRSTDPIVQWINQQFKTIFPAVCDMAIGAIPFHPSLSTHTQSHGEVQATYYHSRQEEAEAIAQRVASELENHPQDTIAILVRSRTQLTEILHALKTHAIPYQGVEMHRLSKLGHLRDVHALTEALLMPANRLAWLTVLRSPWCGLTLPDLLQLANFDKKKSIYFALSQLEQLPALSPEGALRANSFYQMLLTALKTRHQCPLALWIADTLHALHSAHRLTEAQQQDVEQYLQLLEKFEVDGQIADWPLFLEAFNGLYSKQTTPSKLHVMTIHKSKGLEFDCVILPGLSARLAEQDTELMRWLNLPTPHGDLCLISPMKSAQEERCLLYNYLGKLNAEKERYEQQRLFYVATTRAKKRLYLTDYQANVSSNTLRALLHENTFLPAETPPAIANQEAPQLIRQFFPLELFNTTPPPPALDSARLPPISLAPSLAKIAGIATHELLQWIGDNHPDTPNEIPWTLTTHIFHTFGLDDTTQHQLQQQIQQQVSALLDDSIGQWIMKRHENERNEYAFLAEEQGEIRSFIIDRTFTEQGIRWIIDFKTGTDALEQQHHHHEQVARYAYWISQREALPVHCGLYYLANNHWVTW